jgi:serine/threonine protein phosphatase PrpC
MGCTESSVALTPSGKAAAAAADQPSTTVSRLPRSNSEYLSPFVCCSRSPSSAAHDVPNYCARFEIIRAVEQARTKQSDNKTKANNSSNSNRHSPHHADSIDLAALDILLSGTRIGDQGAQCLAAFLKANYRFVRSLWLRNCAIGPAGARSITRELRFNEQITSLSMAHNPITNTGVDVLLEHLGSNLQLSVLDLSNTRVDCVTAKRLARALLGHSQLETIDLSENSIRTVGVNSLVAALRANCHVRQLNLRGNPGFNDQADKQLEGLLERNTVVGAAVDALWLRVGQVIDERAASGSTNSLLLQPVPPPQSTNQTSVLGSPTTKSAHQDDASVLVTKLSSLKPWWNISRARNYASELKARASRLASLSPSSTSAPASTPTSPSHHDLSQRDNLALSSECSSTSYHDESPWTTGGALSSSGVAAHTAGCRHQQPIGSSQVQLHGGVGSDNIVTQDTREHNRSNLSLQPTVGLCESIGRRASMQNVALVKSNFIRHKDSTLVGVMDGHGGIECARFVGGNLGHILETELTNAEAGVVDIDEVDVPACLDATFEQLDAMCHEFDIPHGSCTLVSLIRRGVVYTACAGDSRAMFVDDDPARHAEGDPDKETAQPAMVGHSDTDASMSVPVSTGFAKLSTVWRPTEPSEATRIAAQNGFVSKTGRVCGVLAVSRALGDLGFQPFISPKPGITVHRPSAAGTLVLGCDGLWDAVSTDRVLSIVHAHIGSNPASAASELVRAAQEAGARDNVTALVVRVPEYVPTQDLEPVCNATVAS